MNKHDTGWHQKRVGPEHIEIQESDETGYTVASVWGGGDAMNASLEYRARLIVAAPEMRAMLEGIVARGSQITFTDIRALLARIDGDQS